MTEAPSAVRTHEQPRSKLANKANGQTLAAGTLSGTVQLYLIPTDQQIGEPLPVSDFDAGIESVAFDPHGRYLAAGGTDGSIRLWDLS